MREAERGRQADKRGNAFPGALAEGAPSRYRRRVSETDSCMYVGYVSGCAGSGRGGRAGSRGLRLCAVCIFRLCSRVRSPAGELQGVAGEGLDRDGGSQPVRGAGGACAGGRKRFGAWRRGRRLWGRVRGGLFLAHGGARDRGSRGAEICFVRCGGHVRTRGRGTRARRVIGISFRYSVTAITSRSHRGDPGSTPGIGVFLRRRTASQAEIAVSDVLVELFPALLFRHVASMEPV